MFKILISVFLLLSCSAFANLSFNKKGCALNTVLIEPRGCESDEEEGESGEEEAEENFLGI